MAAVELPGLPRKLPGQGADDVRLVVDP